jgi:hydrogenase-1 operon protein HyaF
MKPFPIPVVAIGPGSQQTEEEELSYLELPREMNTFSMPSLPDPEQTRGLLEAREAVRWLVNATTAWRPGSDNPRFDIAVLDAANRELLDQVLGEGEVSIIIGGAGAPDVNAQESVFTGVWRVRELGPDGSARRDLVEVGPVPEQALAAARAAASTAVPRLVPPADAFSAPPVLEEVAHRCANRVEGDPAHVINLSLLPMSPSDGEHLGRVLAAGPVRILSRGYGSCRITSTVVRDTWWVQYVNGYGKTMVDSIEITDVPEVALASAEDIAESSTRLREALEWLERA